MEKTTKSIIVMIFIITVLLSFAVCVAVISQSQETLYKAWAYDHYKPFIDRIAECRTMPMVICG
jgi:hypothetical protein